MKKLVIHMDAFHPFLDKSLKFKWSKLTPEQALIDIPLSIKNCQNKINELTNLLNLADDQINFNSTFKVFDEMFDEISQAWSLFTYLNSVKDSPTQRSAFKELNPQYIDFSTSIYHNTQLWQLFKRSYSKIQRELNDSKKKISDVELRYVEKVIHDFQRSGADLDDEGKEEMSRINKELADVTDTYKRNLLDSRIEFEFFVKKGDEHLLEGLPETAIALLSEKKKGKSKSKEEGENNKNESESVNNNKNDDDNFYRFSLDAPLVSLVMKYARNESIRKRMWEGLCSIGKSGNHNNSELVYKILELRDRKAKLLGYKSFADFMTEKRMIKTGDNALNFIDELRDRCYEKYLEENKELRKFKTQFLRSQRKKQETNKDEDNENFNDEKESEIFPWEHSYYSELLRQEKYDFNDELLRPYFSVSNVMKGVFAVTSTIYGIEVKERRTFYYPNESSSPVFNDFSSTDNNENFSVDDSIEVWNQDVKYYEVYDKESHELLGAFYADWFPRNDKRSGAWEKQLVLMSNVSPRNIATINGSLAKAVDEKPALLTRRSAQTIFHEFGHLCHFLLSRSPIKSLFGTHVMRDFVEFPSRFLENWTWDKESLDLFAKHYETNGLIPNDLFDKMIKARNFHSATQLMGQLRISKVDLELHHHLFKYYNYKELEQENEKNERLSIDVIDEMILHDFRDPDASLIRSPSLMYNSKHLFASSVGYAADYYSYKWAEVLEADVFTRFKEGGIMNEELGHKIRDTIMSQGNMKPPDELFRNFMGRDPDSSAFFARYGI